MTGSRFVGPVLGSVCFILLTLSGCTTIDRRPQIDASAGLATPYRSSVSTPRAKALYAFCQFRLYGGEGRWNDAVAALERAVAFDPESLYLQTILAKSYLHTNRADQAVEVLTQLIAKKPDYFEGHELLAQILSHQAKYDQAVQSFRQALELQPDNLPLRIRLAVTTVQLGNTEAAIQILDDILIDQPESLIAQLALARVYADDGQLDQAIEWYRRVVTQVPENQQVILELGTLLMRTDVEAAQTHYQDALEHNPEAVVVRQRLAQILLSKNELLAAREQFRIVLDQQPDNFHALGRMALIDLELESWSDAEAGFRSLLTLDEKKDQNRYYLALSLAGQGRFEEAAIELERIEVDSVLHADAVLQRAYYYSKTGRKEKAVLTLRGLLDNGTGQADAYYYLAAFLGDLQRYAEAVEVLTEGIDKYPEEVRLLYQLGIAYEKQDMRLKAVAVMEKILTQDSKYADALNYLAYYQAEGDIDLNLALERAMLAYELNPSGYVADTLGWVYFKLGRYQQGRHYLEEAVAAFPQDAVILEHLGDLYHKMGMMEQALSSYRKALEFDPDAASLKTKIGELQGELPR